MKPAFRAIGSHHDSGACEASIPGRVTPASAVRFPAVGRQVGHSVGGGAAPAVTVCCGRPELAAEPDIGDEELERRLYRGPAHAGAARFCARPSYTVAGARGRVVEDDQRGGGRARNNGVTLVVTDDDQAATRHWSGIISSAKV